MYVGWWAIPALITIIAYGVALKITSDDYKTGGSFIDLTPLTFLISISVATVVSLIPWLIYFIIF